MLSADSPVLEVYYASTCEPCHKELPALAQMDDGTRLVIYVLGNAGKGKRDLYEASPALVDKAIYVSAGTDQRATLRQAGNADGILPFARSVKADGTLCGSWRGILTQDRIRILLNSCYESAPRLP